MSDHRDSTTAPKSIGELTENIVGNLREKLDIKDRERLSAFADLEHQICCLRSMASIVDELLDTFIVDFETKSGRPDRSNGLLTVKLGEYEMNMLGFAWKDVVFRAGELEKSFFAAGNGEVRL